MATDVKIKEGQNVSQCILCKEPASSFCRRCWVNLCNTCVPIHLRVKSQAGHVIVNFADKYSDDNETGFCESHPQKECSSYCKSCEVPICVECVSHESHEKIKLSDKIEELLKDINRENSRIQSFRHKLETLLNHINKQLASVPSFYQKKKDEVTERGQDWYKQVEMTVKKLHLELVDMEDENKTELLKQRKEIEEMVERAVGMIRKATELQTSKNVSQMQKFKPLIEKHETLTELNQYTFPTFHECKIDENYLKTYFGFIERMPERRISLLEKKIIPDSVSDRKVLDVPLVSTVFDTGFPARVCNNNRLYVMAFTEDKKVWMGGEGTKLKLFDLQGNLHRTVTIKMTGLFICMYKKQLVYSDHDESAVKEISDDDTSVIICKTGDWKPYGIANTSSGDLLVCLRKTDESKVVRYNSTGTVLQEIQYNSQCKPLYEELIYVTENVNGDVVVADWKKKMVIAVDKLGIFRFSYKGKNDCTTLDTDSVGHIFVTDFTGNKIHMLDKDGRFLRFIIPEGGIKNPRALAMVNDGQLIIGECITGLAKIITFLDEATPI